VTKNKGKGTSGAAPTSAPRRETGAVTRRRRKEGEERPKPKAKPSWKMD